MLCEASSIIKAIETAWNESGKPSEFSIKVLEAGEKGILWFTKQPAIVSISYDPRRQTEKQASTQSEKKEYINQPRNNPNEKKKRPQQQDTQAHGSHENRRREQTETRPLPQHAPAQQKQKNITSQSTTTASSERQQDLNVIHSWTEDQVTDISSWLQEIMLILKNESSFTTTVDKKILRVFLDQYIVPEAEENKSLYISLASLFMQALKKKHKKKFQGFSIIMAIKGSPHHGNQKSDAA